MNGPTVLLLLIAGMGAVFVGLVWFDRWLDDRETQSLIDAERRRTEARDRLADIYRTNPGRIRLGHPDPKDTDV